MKPAPVNFQLINHLDNQLFLFSDSAQCTVRICNKPFLRKFFLQNKQVIMLKYNFRPYLVKVTKSFILYLKSRCNPVGMKKLQYNSSLHFHRIICTDILNACITKSIKAHFLRHLSVEMRIFCALYWIYCAFYL